jgi:hypothetical protein
MMTESSRGPGIAPTVLGVALCVAGSACQSSTPPALRVAAQGVSFETPVAFSQPAHVGLEAAELDFPSTAKMGADSLHITLVRLEPQQPPRTDEQRLDAARGAFFGTVGPVKAYKDRMFLGQVVHGDVDSPDGSTKQELYLVPLDGARRLVVGFVWTGALPDDEAERIIATVARTMRADPSAPML